MEPVASYLSSVSVSHTLDISQEYDVQLRLLLGKMAVKHCIPRILNERRLHYFRERWPNESPLEINAYKLKALTGLGQGTCLKIFNDLFYVPDTRVINILCEYFDLQPGEFLYYERNSPNQTSAMVSSAMANVS